MSRGTATAAFGESGTLTLQMPGTQSVVRETAYNSSQTPVLLHSGDTYYLFWAESKGIRMMTGTASNLWSEAVLLVQTESLPRDLSAAVVDGTPCISYYQQVTESGTTRRDLYTAVVDTRTADLVLQGVGFDREALMTSGVLTLTGEVYNNGLMQADSFTVTVRDGEGTVVAEKTVEKKVASGGLTGFTVAFVPTDGTNAYTVTAQPVGAEEGDPSDNALTLAFDDACAVIRDASFVEGADGGVELRAYVQNSGLVSLADLTTVITAEDGTVLARTTADEPLARGAYQQALLCDALPDTYYRVAVYSGERELDSTMLRYTDPSAVTLSVSGVTVSGDTAQLTLTGQNQEEGSRQLILALYRADRMETCALTAVGTLNGTQSVTFSFDAAVPGGDYSYKLFILSEDGSMIPLAVPKSGTVKVGG